MKYILLIICLCIPSICIAQIYRYIGIQNGLGNQKIYRIQKDNQGYMWLLTNKGVDRYDGKGVKNYKLADGSKKINPRENLNWISLDKSGVLWVLGRKGRIFRYDSTHDRFRLEFKLPKFEQENPSVVLSYAYMDSNDRIWLCNKDSITIYNPVTRQSTQTLIKISGNITSIIQTDSTSFFLGADSGLYSINMKNGQLQPQSCKAAGNIKTKISELYFHTASQKLFIGTFQDGILIYDLHHPSDIRSDLTPQDAIVTRIATFSDHEVLIATNGKGVFKMNIDSCRVEPYISANYDSYNEMNGDNIIDVYVDDEKRIWMVNSPGGITIRDNRYIKYEWLKHSIGNSQSLINDQVHNILEDSEGDLWFGTSNGISLCNSKTGKWHSFLSTYDKETEDKNHVFMALCEISPGIIWVGGYTLGIYQINKRTLNVEHISSSLYSLSDIHPNQYIRVIKKDSEGNIWSGGYYNLKCFNPKEKKARLYAGVASINSVLEQDNEHMWVGTSTGLYQLNKKTGVYLLVDYPSEFMNVCALYQTEDNILYIGTNGSGLIAYDITNKKFTQYHTDNCALISNNIYTITHISDDNLLMSTENGIVIFSPSKGQFHNWTKEQGLMSYCFNAGSGTLCKNGDCILGSNNGAIRFPANIRLPTIAPSAMVLSDFQISYQPAYPGEQGSPLELGINETQYLNLKYAQNTFSLKASSINYDYPSNILYSWKLDGFYNDWSQPEPDGIIQYTHLPPGEYTLRIRSLSSEERYKVFDEKAIYISIAHPLWASTWAIVGYIFLFMLITGIIIRIVILRRQKIMADEKSQFFINTAHDIRTPITLIKAPLEEILANKMVTTDGISHMNMALKNLHALLRLTTNLINFGRTDIYSSELYVSEHEINSYMAEMCNSFRAFADSKHIEFTYESNFRYLNVWFDRDKMDSILRNLISNAIKYTPENGKVHISASESRDTWKIEISDTGIGIPADEQKRIFRSCFRASNALNTRVSGTGVGLILVRKLMYLHKGKIYMKSAVQEGTTIDIIFPKGNKHFRKAHFISQPQTDAITQMPEWESRPIITKTEKRIGESSFSHRILVVEDNDDLRAYLVDMLDKSYKVYECCNGKEAISEIGETRPDLILSDIMMPEMRGDELCAALKNNIETSHIPIILLTALSDEKNILEGLNVGADDYIVKPFSVGILKASISNLLKNRALLRQRYGNPEIEADDVTDYPTNSLDRKFMIAVKEHVEKNLDNPEFNVDMLCMSVNMSRSSFYNKLKALTDCSPSDYIRSIRLQHASQLLQKGEYSIAEVAEKTGFCDAKYFREVFKKHFKVSPSQHIKDMTV